MLSSIKVVFLFSVLLSCTSLDNKKSDRYLNVISVDTKLEQRDTLLFKCVLKENQIVDLYFSKNKIQIPYYLPTNSFLSDSTKSKECITYEEQILEGYYKESRCYIFNKNEEVAFMSISGSGVFANLNYVYDSFGRVVSVEGTSNYDVVYDDYSNSITNIFMRNPFSEKEIKFVYNE